MPLASPRRFTPEEITFLDDLEHRAFLYFWESADPATGLVPDRARADGSAPGLVASTASTGFGLAALALGAFNGWVPREAAVARAELTLRTCLERLEEVHGFLYHFIDLRDLKRAWNCELSSIDTALLLLGALTAGRAFAGTAVEELAAQLYERVDWPWMATENYLIRHGWTPEHGFLPYNWDAFSEGMGMVLLALGSPTHPLPPAAWAAWERRNWAEYGGRRFLHHPPLFVHQFSHAFVDFKGLRDSQVNGLDYWQNSLDATLAQQEFCVALGRERFPGCYDELCWGLTSSDSRAGYADWGGPPMSGGEVDRRIDGSVVPCAPAGSLPFAPELCVQTLISMKARYGDFAWGRYGFTDAFHPVDQWANEDIIGIDQGITLLMAENARNGMVWTWFMMNPPVLRALRLARLLPGDGVA